MKKLSLIAFLFASVLSAQVQLGKNVQIGATSTSASSVQYNPTTTAYLFLSFSGPYDDGDANSRTVGVPTSVTCAGSAPATCTVAMTAHGFTTTKNAVDMSNLASWPASPAGAVQQSAQYGSFQIASIIDANHFTFISQPPITYSCSPCTGNIYDASLWAVWRMAAEPYFFGHGTIYGIETSTQSAVANLATWLAGITGTPKFVIDQTGPNDLFAGRTAVQVENDHATVWAITHTAGWKMIQTTMIPAQYGVSSGQDVKPSQINNYYWSVYSPTSAQLASGQYFDQYVDTAMAYRNAPATVPDPSVTSIFGQKMNAVLSAQDSNPTDSPDNTYYSLPSTAGNSVPMHHTKSYEYFSDSTDLLWMAFIGSGVNANGVRGLNLYATGNYSMFHMFNANLSAGQDWFPDQYGIDYNTGNNSFEHHFHYAGSGSTSNYFGLTYAGAGTADVWRAYADREFVLPGIATSASTAPACFNGTLGGLTNVGCVSGGVWGSITGTLSSQSDLNTALGLKATLASPTFTGTPAAPTAAPGTNTTQLASTAFVQAAVTAGGTAFSGGLGTSFQDVTEIAAPANPAAGNDRIYTNSTTHKVACLTSGGADCMPSGSGTVTTSGSPASGDIAAFSSATAITTATVTQVNTLIKTLTGCNTVGNVYTPQSGTCVTPSAGSGAWTNITSTLTITGCGTNTGGVCTVSGTTTTNLSVTSIPAHNRIQFVLRGESSVGTDQTNAAYVVANFNSDSTAGHYILNGIAQNGTSAAVTQASTSTNLCVFGQMGTASVGQVISDIPFYADTTFPKSAFSSNSSNAGGFLETLGCGWTGTAAITQADISLTLSAHYIAGTKLMVLVQD